jgi:hypothetical protein
MAGLDARGKCSVSVHSQFCGWIAPTNVAPVADLIRECPTESQERNIFLMNFMKKSSSYCLEFHQSTV